MNFLEIESLTLFQYLLLLRDGFINRLSQSEGGREYLDNCYLLEQTKPDRKKLKEIFGKEDKDG